MHRLRFFFFYFFVHSAHAQIATTSYDKTLTSINPAAIATRELSIISLSSSYTETRSALNALPSDFMFNRDNWKKESETSQYELIYGGKKNESGLMLETYFGLNRGDEEVFLKNYKDYPYMKRRVKFYYPQISTAYWLFPSLAIGLQGFFFEASSEYNYLIQDNTGTFKVLDEFDTTYTNFGITPGLLLNLGDFLYLGYYQSVIHQKTKFREYHQYYHNYSGSSEVNEINTRKFHVRHKIVQQGIGVAIQNGTMTTGGFRIEGSYSVMDTLEKGDPYKGKQSKLSVEATAMGFTGGAYISETKSRFLYYRQFMEHIMAESRPHNEKHIDYGGFLGFKNSRGHSIGIGGSYISKKDKTTFLNHQVTSDTRGLKGSLTYSYQF